MSSNASLDALSDTDLRAAIADATARMRRVDAATSDQVRLNGDGLLAEYGRALSTITEAGAELRKRDGHKRTLLSRLRHAQVDPVSRALQQAALDLGGQLELQRSRLTEAEGQEIRDLVYRWRELSADERSRVETLVGTAAGDAQTFEKRRRQANLKEGLERARQEQRRHPQAHDLVAAVFGDPALFDALRHRHRPEVVEVDEYGAEHRGMTGRILEPDHVAALFMLVSLIVSNGGHDIEVQQAGMVGTDLPRLPKGTLTQLRLSGYVTVLATTTSLSIGLGPRTRDVAAQWNIALPSLPLGDTGGV